LEEKLILRNVPYRVYGGVNFYQRKEIKDILAYLKTIDNGSDGQAVKRIINVPKRGIGATTIDRIQQFADENDMSFWDALCNASEIPDIGRSLSKLENFVTFIQGYKAKQQYMSIEDLTNGILEDTRYMESLAETETREEIEARQENIDEFINKIVAFESGNVEEADGETEERTLGTFLAEVALIADIDNLSETNNQVSLMTLHSAKGLEFPIVYLTGLEDGLFPSYMTIVSDDPTEVEEERRLCYVGITRAEKELIISCAKQRMVRGETQMNKVSRFVKEIPEEYLEVENNVTGYNKSKIDFGGEESNANAGRFNPRAQAKDVLARYGSGNAGQYESYNGRRTSISGRSTTNYGSSGSSGSYGVGRSATNYGSSGVSRSTTNYGSGTAKTAPTKYGSGTNYGTSSVGKTFSKAEQAAIRNVSAASENKKVGFGKEFPVEGETVLNYGVGDRVSHVKFGEGVVKAVEKATKDYMVTVDFEDYGVKKMLAGFARLKKV
jgi:DNA helicase-2/ATP-dependent DNA helicase PcrA